MKNERGHTAEIPLPALFRWAVDVFIRMLTGVLEGRGVKNPVVRYRANGADREAWRGWVQSQGGGVTIGKAQVQEWLWWGMQSWFNDGSTVDYVRRVRLSWIFGKEARRRHGALPAEVRTRIVRSHVKRDIQRGTALDDPVARTHYATLRGLVTAVRLGEEIIKQRYYGTTRGVQWCIANTTLYHHKSVLCATCRWRSDCKELLRSNYPSIYKLRGYASEEGK